MRKSWRTWGMFVLLGAWPHLGCHQLPANKSAPELRPIPKDASTAKKLELTAADITQTGWLANVEALEKAGKYADAIALCERMRQPGSPHAAQATRRIAVNYERMDDRDRAEQEYRVLLQQNPRDADALAKLGDLNKARGHWHAAAKFYEDAVLYKPDHASARSGLAMTLAQNGAYDRSFDEYNKLLRSEAEAYCEVAFVMTMQGKTREAIRMYEEALKKEPLMRRATMELAKVRLTDTPPSVTPYKSGKRADVEHETAPPYVIEGTSRQRERQPTLPPLSPEYYDVPASSETPLRWKSK